MWTKALKCALGRGTRMDPVAMPHPRLAFWAVAAVAAATLGTVLALAEEGEATHYRGGTLWMEADQGSADPYAVRLHARIYLQASHTNPIPGADGMPIQLGGTATPSMIGPICFGDGSCADVWVPRVFSVDAMHETIGYEAWGPDGERGIPHRYDGPGPWTYWFGTSRPGEMPATHSGGRLPWGPSPEPTCVCDGAFHLNNPSTAVRLEGSAGLPARQAYKEDAPPIVPCDPMTLCVIPLKALGPLSAIGFSTPAQATGGADPFNQPGPCPNPSNAYAPTLATGAPPGPCGVKASYICGSALCWAPGPGACCLPGPTYHSVSLQFAGQGTDRSPLEFLILMDPHPIIVDEGCGFANWYPYWDGERGTCTPPPPVADFSWVQPMQCQAANQVTFEDLSTILGSIAAWHWDFGDGADSSLQHPDHDYGSDGGTYEVTLTVTNWQGLWDSATKVVTAEADPVCATEQQPHPSMRKRGPPRDGVDEGLASMDSDGDGVPDRLDACPTVADPGQVDLDGDLAGDACDGDRDEDGIADLADLCPGVADPGQADGDHNGLGDACDPSSPAISSCASEVVGQDAAPFEPCVPQQALESARSVAAVDRQPAALASPQPHAKAPPLWWALLATALLGAAGILLARRRQPRT